MIHLFTIWTASAIFLRNEQSKQHKSGDISALPVIHPLKHSGFECKIMPTILKAITEGQEHHAVYL